MALAAHKNQPMAYMNIKNSAKERFEPAPSPLDFETFANWLTAATTIPGIEKPGLQAQLADYLAEKLGEKEPSPSLVNSWIKRGSRQGSLPSIPRVRVIADWARVPFEDLKALYDKDAEARQAAPRARGGGRPVKKPMQRSAALSHRAR